MPTIHWLDPANLRFPPLSDALENPNGLLAVGGDLSVERLLAAYRHGVFPWYEDPQPILWWSPDPRAVLFPDRPHISRSLHKRLRRGDFTVTADRAFHEVITKCGEPTPERPGTWITDDMFRAYTSLHRQGWAHSIEVWQGLELIGGLYGVSIGRVFFGESMFTRRRDGSKIALVYLAGQLNRWGFKLIDCQVGNDHLYRMGAEDIERESFADILRQYADPVADDGERWELDWHYSDRIA